MEENNINENFSAITQKNSNKKIVFLSKKSGESSKTISKLDKEHELLDLNPKNENVRPSRYYSEKKLTKLTKIVTEETLIYDILFDYISEDGKKKRNYEKVSNEIKRIEQKNEVEKLKLKKKIDLISQRLDTSINKNKRTSKKEKEIDLFTTEMNLRNKTLEMKELDKDKKLNFFELIQKLEIPPEQRSIKDILRIKPFIEKSNLAKTFYDTFTDITTIEKLINFCCIEMVYKKFNEGEIIYKIGDVPNEFYSIIFGKVHIIKVIVEHKIMSGFEYFCYLMNLKNNNEIYLLHKSIEINSNNYHINENHIEFIHYIYLYNYLKTIKKKENTNISFIHLLDLIKINPEELGIESSQINDINYLINNIKIIKKNFPFITEKIIQKYSFLDDDLTKKDVTIYKNEVYQVLKSNDYFGDDIVKEEHSLTAISDVTSEVAVLPYQLYNSEIALLKSAALENKITDLHSSHFFHKIKYFIFRKKYYKLFTLEKYYNGDILFKEGEKIKYIYFIKEGNVQLNLSKSINDIDDLIALLIKRKKTIKLNNNINTSYKETENSLNYTEISSTYDDLVNFLDKKQNNKLIFLSNKEEIGLVSNFIGNDYLTSCVVVSKEAKIYKIDVKYINQMLKEEKDCVEEHNERIENKLNLLIQGLFKINNIKLIMIDDKINLEKIDEKNFDEKKKLTNTSKIKGLINYNKLNDVLNSQSLNNPNSSNSNINEDSIKLPFLSRSIKSPQRHNSTKSNNSPKKNSKDYKDKKANIFKKQLNFIDREELNKNARRNNTINRSRDNLLMSLNKKSKINSGFNKKVSKIKLHKNKINGIDHKILEKLFITPPQQNNNNILIYKTKNKINKNSGTSSFDYKLRKKKNYFNHLAQQLTEADKSHSHPYYDPRMVIKRNRFKVFEDIPDHKKIRIENMKMQMFRLKQLKTIHSSIKKTENNYEDVDIF